MNKNLLFLFLIVFGIACTKSTAEKKEAPKIEKTDPCTERSYDVTKLHDYAKKGYVRWLDSLLKTGIPVDCIDDDVTALWMAALKNKYESVKVLLKYGADPNFKDRNGKTPVHIAASSSTFETVKLLANNGGNLKSKGIIGTTVLHQAVKKIRGKKIELVKYLLDNNLDIHAKNIDNSTPIIIAGGSQDPDLLKFLIANGANPNDRDIKGYSPLINSVYNECLECVKVLIEAGADIETKDNKNNTVLNIACMMNRNEISIYLLSKGANPFTKNDKGETPYSLAKMWKMTEVIKRMDKMKK